MKLVLAVAFLAILLGYLAGGRFVHLTHFKLRWPFLAPLGLAIQMLPAGRHDLALALLYLSFLTLSVFVLANVRTPGFALILLGLALNITVIAANHGMPVPAHTLVESGQADTLSLLIHGGGVKHHLASSSDVLTPLSDVIPVAAFRQAMSVGDVMTDAGIVWLIVAGMKWRPEEFPHSVQAGSIEERPFQFG